MSAKLVSVLALTILGADPQDDPAAKHAPVSVAFAAYSSDAQRVGIHDATAQIDVEAAWVSIQGFRLHAASACRQPPVTSVDGPLTADLITGHATGPGPDVAVRPGSFCAIDVVWRRSRERTDGAPPELRRASILIVGKRADGVAFTLRSRIDTASRLVATDLEGFAVPPDGIAIVLAADVARWFEGIDLTTADIDVKGTTQTIRVDAESNPALLERFESNLGLGLGVFTASDDDRRKPLATGGP